MTTILEENVEEIRARGRKSYKWEDNIKKRTNSSFSKQETESRRSIAANIYFGDDPWLTDTGNAALPIWLLKETRLCVCYVLRGFTSSVELCMFEYTLFALYPHKYIVYVFLSEHSNNVIVFSIAWASKSTTVSWITPASAHLSILGWHSAGFVGVCGSADNRTSNARFAVPASTNWVVTSWSSRTKTFVTELATEVACAERRSFTRLLSNTTQRFPFPGLQSINRLSLGDFSRYAKLAQLVQYFRWMYIS